MTQFLTENPYYVDPYGFQGDALIYREAGLLSNPLGTAPRGGGSASPPARDVGGHRGAQLKASWPIVVTRAAGFHSKRIDNRIATGARLAANVRTL